jgi:hyperosmotically inducible protein
MKPNAITAVVVASFLALGGIGACSSTRTQQSTGEYIDDAAITAKVKAALIEDKDVKALDVNVETFKGTVQLSGFADSQAQIDRAVQLAKEVNGVKEVKNAIRVKTAG